ncbi:MAG: MOSC domain-containing protein [bacterium]
MPEIVALSVSLEKGVPKDNRDKVTFIAGRGIEGDAHAAPGLRQVSLLAVDSIGKMREKGLDVSPGAFAENVTTRGIELPALELGTELRLGKEVVLRVSQIGKVCHDRCRIYYQAGDCVMPREGIFGEVTVGGEVSVGDSIEIISPSPTV